MAVHGLDLSKTMKYESMLDPKRGTKEATVFELRTLDSFITGRVQDRLTEYEASDEGDTATTKVNVQEAAIEMCRFGIAGWSNFPAPDGKLIEFVEGQITLFGKVYPVVDNDVLRRVPGSLMVELQQKLRSLSTLTVGEVKNSDEE